MYQLETKRADRCTLASVGVVWKLAGSDPQIVRIIVVVTVQCVQVEDEVRRFGVLQSV